MNSKGSEYMIQRCSEKHREMLMEYLYQDKVTNVFLIGDIINFGFNNDFQTVFMDFETEIKTVYLIYRSNLAISSRMNRIDMDFIEKVVEEYQITTINGKKELMEQVVLKDFIKEDCSIAKLDCLSNYANDKQVQRLTIDRLQEAFQQIVKIFPLTKIDGLLHALNTNTGRVFVYYVNGEIVSFASSTAECDDLAMIVRVGTLQEHRGYGYATKVVSALVQSLLSEGKTPVLFFSDPLASKIYYKIGFKDVGEYTIQRKDMV